MLFESSLMIATVATMTTLLIGGGTLWMISNRASKKHGAHGRKEDDDHTIAKQGFSKRKIPEEIDMIVIGSGVGGLTVAAIMAKEGKKVLVLEQHDVAGGTTHTFDEHGYEFDTGVHYVGGKIGCKTAPLRKLFDYISDNGIQWEKMDEIFDVAIINDGTTREEFPIHSSIQRVKQDLTERFPSETEAIDKYFKLVRKIKLSIAVLFITRFLPAFLVRWLSPLFLPHLQLFQQTTHDVLSSLTSDKKLIGVLTYMWGDYGEPPSRGSFALNALIADHFINGGGFYPVGGPAVIARRVIRVIERSGGKVLVRAPVSRILVSESGTAYGVEVKGNEIHAPLVISTAGAPNTYQKLVPKEHAHRIQTQLKGLQDTNVAPAISLMSLFVGLKGDAKELSIPSRNLWVFPSWEHDANCEAYQRDLTDSFPAVFMSFSSVKDPTYEDRHPGRQVALVIATAYYEHFEEFKDARVKHRGHKYETIKKELAERLKKELLKEFPQLEGKIEFSELGTPVTNDFYLGNYRGAVYGLSHTPKRFVDSDWLSVQTPIKGLYLSGQDTFSCGIAGAAASGLLTALTINRALLLRKAYLLA